MSAAIEPYEETGGLMLADPEAVIEQAARAAKALTRVVQQAHLSVSIGGSKHLKFEAWQTVARFYNLSACVDSVDVHTSDGDEMAFRAKASVVDTRTGIRVGGAEAICSSKEKNWEGKDYYQISSMAQTRAMAKALRSVLAFVVVLAGYEATPAEEMESRQTPPQAQGRPRPPQGKQSPVHTEQTDYACPDCGYEGLTRYDNPLGKVIYAHKVGGQWHRFTEEDGALVPA